MTKSSTWWLFGGLYTFMHSFIEWIDICEAKHIPDEAIKVHLPKVNQTKNYTCGPACLRSIARYFGVGPKNEEEFSRLVKADPKNGTTPNNIIEGAKKLGLCAFGRQHMTIEALISRLSKSIPVICCVQAWGNEKIYPKDGSGHYVIAIGFDDKHIYFEDPSLEQTRGLLSHKDFLKRWHDKEADGSKHERFGIAIWHNAKPTDFSRTKKAKVIE